MPFSVQIFSALPFIVLVLFLEMPYILTDGGGSFLCQKLIQLILYNKRR